MDKYNGIVVSLIAGLSTIIGFFSIYIKGSKNKIIGRSLSFAGGVMIMLSIIDLIPSSITNLEEQSNYILAVIHSFIFFIVGFVIIYIIQNNVQEKEGLYKTGIISMIGIMVHNIPEGIATYVLSTIDLKLGILLAVAVIMHNIPEGIGIAIPVYYGTHDKKKAFIYTLVSGLSELIGAVVSFIFLYKFINNTIMGILYAIISGLMIYIGYFELIKNSKKYENDINTYIMLGMLFILIVEIILK